MKKFLTRSGISLMLFMSVATSAINVSSMGTSIKLSKPKAKSKMKSADEIFAEIQELSEMIHESRNAKVKVSESKKLVASAKEYLGVRYKWGGSSRKGIDCSAFVKTVYKKHDVVLPRTSYKQIKVGEKVKKVNAEVGDLIFFGDKKRHVGHVGIIIDPVKKLMIHASSAKGKVVIGSYNTSYYNRKYRGVRRV